MLIPPFCPHCDCEYHSQPPAYGRWYHVSGSYETLAHGEVTRFKCLGCGGGFSEQTFSLDYYVKRKLDYQVIFDHLTNCGGVRKTARIMKVSHQAITNRLGRLARQAIALQADILQDYVPCEELVTDGFESFVSDQYQPNNIHLLAGKSSQFFITFDYAHLRRKGTMTELQKAERERRERHYIRKRISISQSFLQIVNLVEQYAQKRRFTCLYSDEKLEYQRLVRGSDVLQSLKSEGRFEHVRISSHLARTVLNPLFSANYLDRQFRKDNANHVRETVRFSQNVNNCLERMAVYQLYQNYFKPFRIGHPFLQDFCHAERAGVPPAKIKRGLRGIFTMRKFYTHVKLNWSQLMVWARMTGTLDKFDGMYWRKYIWR